MGAVGKVYQYSQKKGQGMESVPVQPRKWTGLWYGNQHYSYKNERGGKSVLVQLNKMGTKGKVHQYLLKNDPTADEMYNYSF